MIVIPKDWYLNFKRGRGKIQHHKHKKFWRSLWRTKENIREIREKVASKRKHKVPYNLFFHQAELTKKNDKTSTNRGKVNKESKKR
jgi:hypothetical protein